MKRFELVFSGAATAKEYFPRYARTHQSVKSAETEARRVVESLSSDSRFAVGHDPTASHVPIIYGPGCGRDGRAVKR